jgi:hypothetical protein
MHVGYAGVSHSAWTTAKMFIITVATVENALVFTLTNPAAEN